MRVYRINLYPADSPGRGKPLHYLGEVEDHQRADDVMHQAMMDHPNLVAHHCSLIFRGEGDDSWPMLMQGLVH